MLTLRRLSSVLAVALVVVPLTRLTRVGGSLSGDALRILEKRDRVS